MNPEYERKLEAEVNRELQSLPQLSAPSTLISRVLTAIEQRTNVLMDRNTAALTQGDGGGVAPRACLVRERAQ